LKSTDFELPYPLSFFRALFLAKEIKRRKLKVVPSEWKKLMQKALWEYEHRHELAEKTVRLKPTKFDLLPYQEQDLKFALWLKRAALFWEQGMGKTVAGVEWLRQIGASADDALVVVPRRHLVDVWREHGAPATVVTYASLHKVADRRWRALILDESHSIKDLRAKRTKLAHKIGNRAEYVLLLSGTPVTKDPLDLYSQMKLLWPQSVVNKQFFLREFVVLDPTGTFPVAYKNVDKLIRRLLAFSSVRRKEDHLSLPGKEIVFRRFEFPYAGLSERMQATLDLPWGESIDNHLVLYQKLHQLSAGILYGKDRVERFPLPKTEALVRDAVLHDGRLVVWYTFREEGSMLEEELRKAGIAVTRAEGGRDASVPVRTFLEGRAKVLLASIHALSEGVNLQKATSTAFYHSLPWSYKDFAQSTDRIHRLGTPGKVRLHLYLNDGFIDEHVWRSLERKRDFTPAEVLAKASRQVRT